MVTRRVAVILEGTSTSLVRSFEQASAAADRAGDRISRVGTHVERNAQAYERAGAMIAGFGAATLAAQGASAAAAISWESDFAGVKKTVDDTAEGYAELSGELRQMATELPASHTAIAGVAEAAGQLGIQRENITSFTRTMIDLGETTNMSADEAATALARFSNIMGTSQDEVSNLGSSIVELGNNYATTEREIVEMGLRLAGAGRQARLTEGEVLGLATALSSVGIEAQAGGTAFSRIIIEMGVAVDTQSDKLRTFADVSGMTAEQFSTAWRDDAGSAIAAFVGGLGEMESAGESIQPILEDLSLTDIRVGDALRRASSASDIFTEAMRTGNEAYAENVALTEEAAQRYETVGSQLGVLKNNVVDAGISMGEVFLPAISAVAEEGGLALRAISDLPEPLRQIAGWGGAAAGGAALLAGGLMMVAPRALETYRALQQVGIIGPRTGRALRNVAGVLTGPWGLAIAGAVTAVGFYIREKQKQKEAIDEVRGTLDDETGALTANTREWVAKTAQESGALELADQLGLSHGVLTNAVMGSASAQETLNDALEGAEALGRANIATQLEKKYDGMRASIEGATAEQARMNAELEAGREATRGMEADTLRLTAQAEAYAQSQTNAAVAVRDWVPMAERAAALGEEAAEAYAKMNQEFAASSQAFIDSSSALGVANEAAQAWAEDQAEAAGKGSEAWESFVGDFTGTVDEWLSELERMAAAQSEWETNMLILASRASAGVVQAFEDLGPQGAILLQEFLDGGAETLERGEAIFGEKGAAGVQAYADGMSNTDVLVAAAARWGDDIMAEVAGKIEAGEMTLAEIVEAYDLNATIHVLGNRDPFDLTVDQAMMWADLQVGTPIIDGDRARFMQRLDEALTAARDSTGTAGIAGDAAGPGRFLATLASAIWTANNSSATVPIYAQLRTNIQAMVRGALAPITMGMSMIPGRADGGPITRASGGPVRGPGGPRDDLVPAYNVQTGQAYRLSNDEHVWAAHEVDAAGGHEEMYRLRKAVLAGAVRYDIGGGIGQDRRLREAYAPRITSPAPARVVAATPVHVSLDGGRITGRLEIGGDGLATLVDGRIQADHGDQHYYGRMVGARSSV